MSRALPASGRLRPVSLACLLWAAGLAACILRANWSFVHDDAYITLRYVRNFLEGAGLVWNPGERVQGYTSVLDVLALAALGAARLDLLSASRALGLASWLALLAGLWWLRPRTGPSARDGGLSLLPFHLAATSAPILVWSLGGLESTLAALLTSLGCVLFLAALDRPRGGRALLPCGVLFGLGILARPDGAVFPAAALAFWVWSRRPLRPLAALLAPIGAIVLPCLVWQHAYYGDWLPNTFYAKAGAISLRRIVDGLRYAGAFCLAPPYLPLLALGAALACALRRRWSERMTCLALFTAAYLAFVLYAGGDYMPAFRLLLPVIVPLSWLLCVALAALLPGGRPLAGHAVIAVALLLSSLQLASPELLPREDPAARMGRRVGEYIARAWPEGSLVALSTAGSTPYYAPRHRYIDMLGLNDRHIAKREVSEIVLRWQALPGHAKGDGGYVLSREPDFIIIGPAHGTVASDPWFLSDLELSRDPRFQRGYGLRQVTLEDGTVFTYYQREAGPPPARGAG